MEDLAALAQMARAESDSVAPGSAGVASSAAVSGAMDGSQALTQELPASISQQGPSGSLGGSVTVQAAVTVTATASGTVTTATGAAKRKTLPRGGAGGRLSKGLRHFSVKVCQKLSQIGITSYNEIANLLVEENRPVGVDGSAAIYDEKNIRRRIYDALNVLMALGIISRENKQIAWNGIDGKNGTSKNTAILMSQEHALLSRIKKKRAILEDMTLQFVAMKGLIDRNNHGGVQAREATSAPMPVCVEASSTSSFSSSSSSSSSSTSSASASASASSSSSSFSSSSSSSAAADTNAVQGDAAAVSALPAEQPQSLLEGQEQEIAPSMVPVDSGDTKLHLPFILINTLNSTKVECEMTTSRNAVALNCNDFFTLHDDTLVLTDIGRAEVKRELIPPELRQFLPSIFPEYSSDIALRQVSNEMDMDATDITASDTFSSSSSSFLPSAPSPETEELIGDDTTVEEQPMKRAKTM